MSETFIYIQAGRVSRPPSPEDGTQLLRLLLHAAPVLASRFGAGMFSEENEDLQSVG